MAFHNPKLEARNSKLETKTENPKFEI